MSTIRVDNLQASDGASQPFGTTNVPKAKVGYQHSVNTIAYSDNISSVTDAATGRSTLNFTNSFSGATLYGVTAMVFQPFGSTAARVVDELTGSKTTSNTGISAGNGATATDYDYNAAVQGDLA